MNKILLTLLCLLVAPVANAFTIPEKLTQGMLVYGTAEPHERIYYEDLRVPVHNGRYVFAIGRNVPDKINVTVKRGLFEKNDYLTFPVAQSKWEIDVINGVPQQKVEPNPAQEARIAKEQKLLDKCRAKRPLSKGFPLCFIKPVKEIRLSAPFGAQRVINGKKLRHHSGVDWAAPKGTPVKAAADGIVILAENDLFFTGGTVLIEHGSGVQTGYSHLSEVDVQNGDEIKQGDVIGKVGSTGRSTGPHLHFTLAWENIRVAPEWVCQESCPDGDK